MGGSGREGRSRRLQNGPVPLIPSKSEPPPVPIPQVGFWRSGKAFRAGMPATVPGGAGRVDGRAGGHHTPVAQILLKGGGADEHAGDGRGPVGQRAQPECPDAVVTVGGDGQAGGAVRLEGGVKFQDGGVVYAAGGDRVGLAGDVEHLNAVVPVRGDCQVGGAVRLEGGVAGGVAGPQLPSPPILPAAAGAAAASGTRARAQPGSAGRAGGRASRRRPSGERYARHPSRSRIPAAVAMAAAVRETHSLRARRIPTRIIPAAPQAIAAEAASGDDRAAAVPYTRRPSVSRMAMVISSLSWVKLPPTYRVKMIWVAASTWGAVNFGSWIPA